MGFFDFLFDLDGDGKVEADEEFISMMMLNHNEALPFFSTPLLKNALALLNSKSDATESVPNMDSVAIDYILNRGICICGTHISPGSAAEHCLLKEKSIQPPEAIGSLVRRYKEQATNYISSSKEFVEMLNSDIRSIREDKRLLAQAKDD